MEVVFKEVLDLVEAEYNPRKISTKQLNDLVISLQKFGFQEPVVVNTMEGRENVIIGGHQRVKAWEKMGNTTVPCVEVKLTLKQEKELNIRLNKNGGEFDVEALFDNFKIDDLVDFGFEELEIEEFQIMQMDEEEGFNFGENEDQEEEPPKELPQFDEEEKAVNSEPSKIDVQSGDLIEIGNHRLLCGDSTLADDVKKVLARCSGLKISPDLCRVIVKKMRNYMPKLPIKINGKPYTPPS